MWVTRQRLGLAGAVLFASATFGCATSEGAGEEHVRVIPNQETKAEEGGIGPERQSDILLVLQNRNPSTAKCYNDVLAEKHDRAFKGNVAVLITIEPNGQASDVKIVNSTLNNKEVHDCLIEKIKGFEFPPGDHRGTIQNVYHFEPAY